MPIFAYFTPTTISSPFLISSRMEGFSEGNKKTLAEVIRSILLISALLGYTKRNKLEIRRLTRTRTNLLAHCQDQYFPMSSIELHWLRRFLLVIV